MNIHYAITQIIKRERIEVCGDSSCCYKKPKGMLTNGGCRCDANAATKVLDFILKNRTDFNNQLDFMEAYKKELDANQSN